MWGSSGRLNGTDANENGFNLQNSTPVADMPQTLTFTEQWSSEITMVMKHMGPPAMKIQWGEL